MKFPFDCIAWPPYRGVLISEHYSDDSERAKVCVDRLLEELPYLEFIIAVDYDYDKGRFAVLVSPDISDKDLCILNSFCKHGFSGRHGDEDFDFWDGDVYIFDRFRKELSYEYV